MDYEQDIAHTESNVISKPAEKNSRSLTSK